MFEFCFVVIRRCLIFIFDVRLLLLCFLLLLRFVFTCFELLVSHLLSGELLTVCLTRCAQGLTKSINASQCVYVFGVIIAVAERPGATQGLTKRINAFQCVYAFGVIIAVVELCRGSCASLSLYSRLGVRKARAIPRGACVFL